MLTPLIVLFFGFFFIYCEFFLPGGLLAFCGALCLCIGLFLIAFVASPALFVFALISTLAILALTIFCALKHIERSQEQNTLMLSSNQEGFCSATFDASLIGQQGVAITNLKPSGKILIHGQMVEAVSLTGYQKKGSTVKIVGGEGAHLEVC